MSAGLPHELLPVEHGFGLRSMEPPPDVVRPKQVHGVGVARVLAGEAEPHEADAIVASEPGQCVAIVTADCVPILVSNTSGSAVAAVHAGWRGLAAGVVERAIAELRRETRENLVAVIGPHIGVCCYEVDAPVLDACRARFGGLDPLDRLGREAAAAFRPVDGKPGHAMFELARLVEVDLARSGVAPDCVARLETAGPGEGACTSCDAERFHSYRRDGDGAGRLLHFIRASEARC